MAGKRTQPDAAAAETAEEESVGAIGDTGPDADAVAEQQEKADKAEAKRESQAEKAEGLKSVPEGAAAPNEKVTPSGETQFRQAWLIENAYPVLGVPPWEVVGAFHGNDQEYLTVDEAQKVLDAYRERVVTVHPLDAEEVAS